MRKPTVAKLKKVADKVFSKWLRKRDKNKCFTCGRFAEHAGHYVSRAFNSLRYDERNVNAQCVGCNIFRYGNMDVYALNLIKKHGKDILIDLAKDKRKIKQFSVKELQDIITKYDTDSKNKEVVARDG